MAKHFAKDLQPHLLEDRSKLRELRLPIKLMIETRLHQEIIYRHLLLHPDHITDRLFPTVGVEFLDHPILLIDPPEVSMAIAGMAIMIESQKIIDMIEIAVIQMSHIEIEMITIEEMIGIQEVDVLDIDVGPRLNFKHFCETVHFFIGASFYLYLLRA